MSFAAQNIVDFVRGFGQRKIDNHTADLEKNYLNDPTGTIAAVQQYNPGAGFKLQTYKQDADKSAADIASTDATAHQNDVEKIIGYTHGLPQGTDADAVLGSIDPAQLGVSPAALAQARAILKTNPGYSQASDKDLWKSLHTPQVVAPGSDVVEGGQSTFRNPLQPKVNVVGSDKAGRQVVVTNPEDYASPQPGTPAAAEPSAIAAGATPAPANAGNYIANGQDPFDEHIAPIEGGTNPDGSFRTSPKGAVGPGQVMPKTGPEAAAAAGLPWDPVRFAHDADYNRALGKAYYAKQLIASKGDEPMAAAMYNAGPGRVARFTGQGLNNRAQALPQETQAYVRKFAPGLFGGAAAPTAGGGRSNVAFSQPPVAPQHMRPATPEELKAAGYADGSAAQVDDTGKFVNLKTPGAGAAGKKGDPVTAFRNALDGIDGLNTQLQSLRGDPERGSIEGMTGRLFQYDTAGTGYRKRLEKLNASKMVELAKGLAGTGTFSRGVTNMEAQQLPKTLAAIAPGMSHDDVERQFDEGTGQLARSRTALVNDAVRQGIATVMKNGQIVAKGERYNGHVYLGGNPKLPTSWSAQ